jgi:hypothetical protein
MPARHDRRSFISGLASLAGVAAVNAAAPHARADTQAGAGRSGPSPRKWELSWLDELKGRHKQVCDLGSLDLSKDDGPLRYAYNYLDAHKEVSGLDFPDVNVAIGMMYSAFPINASDAIWQKYQIGARWNIVDPLTQTPAVRNIFIDDRAASPGVKRLQRRGAVFWQCNVALGRVVATLVRATDLPPKAIRDDLVAGLNPGVRLVPSHVMVVGLAQERGFSYMKP